MRVKERGVGGGRVYGLLNARLTTGGSSSGDPVKNKQNVGSVQLLCDLAFGSTSSSGHRRRRTTAQQEGRFFVFLLFC